MIKWLKKTTALAPLFVIMLSFCGCKGGKIAPVLTDFSCKGRAELENLTVGFEMTRLSGQLFEITVTEPETLAGLKYQKNGDKSNLSYKEIRLEENDTAANDLFAKLIDEAFCVAEKEEMTVTAKAPKFNGKIDQQDFEMTFRPDGFVTELIFKQKDITVTMTEFEYK